MAKPLSIRVLVLGTLFCVFLLVLLATLLFSATTQRERMEHYARQQVQSISKSYFDSLNTMMLTGAMGSRQMLKEKVTAPEEIKDIRVLRGEAITRVFGPGLAGEQAYDDLDRRALNGETIELIHDDEDGRLLTLLVPLRAKADYQGVNCLGCHNNVKEDAVIGAIRMDYSLAKNDAELHASLITGGVIQIILFVIAFFVTAFVLNHYVIQRLSRLHRTMSQIADHSDLSLQFDAQRNDEIGLVSQALNHMVSRINDTLCRVVDNAKQVNQSAQAIAEMSETTEQEVLAQKSNTSQVAAAMTEMAASAEEVKANAEAASVQSQATAAAATDGEQQSQAAVIAIEKLSDEVQQGANRIEELNHRTDEVAAVLAVISSIAEQTNLLALNAAIEAARAGEQGRGFAVVADEVRSLASRTQESTEQIRQTIEGLRSEASDCVQIMGRASSLAQQQVGSIQDVAGELHNIATAVRAICELNIQMETAAGEQSQVAESISCNVIEISESAESTSRDAQQTAQISENLLTMASQLEQSAEQFQLKR